jgi:hypothetical protein
MAGWNAALVPRVALMHKVLAVSSAGMHWWQLMLLRPAFAGTCVAYVSTSPDAGEAVGLESYRQLYDPKRHYGLGSVRTSWQALKIFRAVNPDTVVTTGALLGLIMVVFGRLWGCRTIWVDSIVNMEKLSMCGNVSRRLVHKCFVQWPELATLRGATYAGSVL